MNGRIDWNCATCGTVIADGEGVVELVYSRLHRYEGEQEAWRANLSTEEDGSERLFRTLVEAASMPELAAWRAIHSPRFCAERAPDWEESSYWITVERLRTRDQLLWWTCHLYHKNWFASTDWVPMLEGILGYDREEAPRLRETSDAPVI